MTERQRLIIQWIEQLPREPIRYQVTQPGDPKKSKRTWRHAVRVFLAERRSTSTIPGWCES